jgi:geranylgeranyl diphosphate synthase type I
VPDADVGLPPGFDELLGDPQLTDEQISMLQRTMRDSGALKSVEEMIEGNVARAFTALESSHFSASAVAELRALAERATRRDS